VKYALAMTVLMTACAGDAPAFSPDAAVAPTPDATEETPPDESDLLDTSKPWTAKPGVNSDECIASPYNCRFRSGPPRVQDASGNELWDIEAGASIRDGNGDVLGAQTGTKMRFNWGQTRLLAGKAHALGMSTSNGSAGWYPFERIVDEDAFRARVGNVDAKDSGGSVMACYQIRNSHDEAIELRKVVYDSKVGADGHERAGDYLPLVRDNGVRSANLIFSIPGFGLGGATSDHFPAGTKFQRVGVSTQTGRPSLLIPLWEPDSSGHYVVRNGSMRFIYGYIVGNGVKRYGWMALDALEVSSDCP
jgi:hypothetical protein